jgi:hypothetical protein
MAKKNTRQVEAKVRRNTFKVDAEDNLHAVSPGFGAHSDTVTIKPGQNGPLDITIERSLQVLALSWGSSFSVWFNIQLAN